MKTSWFTFGWGHAHQLAGYGLVGKDHVMEITSENPRQTMVELFGIKWAFQYDEKPDMRYYPEGIVQYPNPTE